MPGTLHGLEIVEEILKNLGDRAESGGSPVATRVRRHVNLAQIRITQDNPEGWRELLVTDEDAAPATPTYLGLPGTIRQLISFRIKKTNSFSPKLIQLSRRQWDQAVGIPETQVGTEEPTHYTLSRLNLVQWQVEWYPSPTDAFTLSRRYSIWPADLVDIAFSALDRKDNMIIAYATHSLFQSLGESSEAARWLFMYKDILQEALKEDRTSPDLVVAARGLSEYPAVAPDPWKDPFVRSTGE